MSLADAVAAVATLVTAFGQKDMTDERIAVYAEGLKGLEPALLDAAVHRIIVSQKFFPALSEIVIAAARISGNLPPTPGEAIALERLANISRPMIRRDGSPTGDVIEEWDWSLIGDAITADLIRDTLARVGGPLDENGKPRFGWEMAFQKTYEQAAEEATATLLASDLSRLRLPAAKPKELGP